MVRVTKTPLFKTNFPNTNFVVGEFPDSPPQPDNPSFGYKLDATLDDDCNTVFTLDTNHPYIKIPSISIVTRNPYCRRIPPPPPPSNPNDYENPIYIPIYQGAFIGLNTFTLSEQIGTLGRFYFIPPICNAKDVIIQSLVNYNLSNITPIGTCQGQFYNGVIITDFTANYKWNTAWVLSNRISEINTFSTIIDNFKADGWNTPDNLNDLESIWTKTITGRIETYFQGYDRIGFYCNNPDANSFNFSLPRIGDLSEFQYSSNRPIDYRRTVSQPTSYQGRPYGRAIFIDEINNKIFPLAVAPFNPPPPPDMSCCPNIRENDALLRLILKRIGTPLNVNIRDYDETTKGYQPRTENQQTLFNASKINTDRVEVANDLIGISESRLDREKFFS
jgi:hypothetical protein